MSADVSTVGPFSAVVTVHNNNNNNNMMLPQKLSHTNRNTFSVYVFCEQMFFQRRPNILDTLGTL